MKKKIISWLSFMAVFSLLLQSCIQDEIYSVSEQEKQEIISKSLWKEDQLFIQRIYDHFQKSFMPSVEEKHKFISQYGTPAWEYAMTMGFGRNQLYVPLITNNHVTGVIRVLRQDKRASYSFMQNPEALDFFETVIYNPYHYELTPQKDQKSASANSAKVGGYTWTCSKRIVNTGWHMEGDILVIETALVEFCKYTYTGMNPPVDHIDVYTDGMESGGGGEDEGEEYEGSPCQKTKNKISDPKFKAKFQELNKSEMFAMDHEKGYYERLPPVGSTGISSGFPVVDGAPCTHGMDLPDNENGIAGLMHIHNDVNCDGNPSVKVPSPSDVRTFLNIFMKQARLYTGSYTNAYSVVITSQGSYMLQYTNDTWPGSTWDKLADWNNWYKKEYDKLIRDDKFTQENVEKVFTRFLEEKVAIDGLEVYKITENSSTKLKYNGANQPVTATPCPQ